MTDNVATRVQKYRFRTAYSYRNPTVLICHHRVFVIVRFGPDDRISLRQASGALTQNTGGEFFSMKNL